MLQGLQQTLQQQHNVSATAVGPLKMLQASAGAWENIGTSDIELFGITLLLTLQMQVKQELLLHTHKIII